MNAVDNSQKDVLSYLMGLKVLDGFYLVGGTNLALRYNHRKSVDLDLFVNRDFNQHESNYLNNKLKEYFGEKYINIQVSKVGVFAHINGVKVDFVNFPYPLLKPVETISNFRLASEIDVAAMKINAIAGRGTRKDFYDIDKLLNIFSLKQIFDAYKTKFSIDNIMHVEKSLIYFNDAQDDVISLENKSWEIVKRNIENSLKKYFSDKLRQNNN